MRNNYTHYYSGIGYGWIPGEESTIQNHGFRVGAMAFTDNFDNSAQSFETELSYDLAFKSGFSGMFALNTLMRM